MNENIVTDSVVNGFVKRAQQRGLNDQEIDYMLKVSAGDLQALVEKTSAFLGSDKAVAFGKKHLGTVTSFGKKHVGNVKDFAKAAPGKMKAMTMAAPGKAKELATGAAAKVKSMTMEHVVKPVHDIPENFTSMKNLHGMSRRSKADPDASKAARGARNSAGLRVGKGLGVIGAGTGGVGAIGYGAYKGLSGKKEEVVGAV